jgi:hypothetical protein
MYLNTTTNLTEYYVDIPACTSENTDVVITRGTAVDGSIPDIYFIRMDIPADFTPGVVKENSEDFISRSDQSITTRELVTRRAYKTVLMDEFDEIFRLYVAGYGSPEQIRDVVEFQNVTVHVGNKADIYIAGKLTTYATEAVIRDDGAAVVSNMSDRACLLLPLDAPRVLNADEFLWGCVGGEPPVLDVQADPARAGEVVPVTWLGNPAVADVTDYIRQEDRRLMTYDPRVKGMFPVLLSMRLSVSRVSDAQDDAPAIRAAVIAYVETVTKSGASWNESEMLAAIHTACPNVKRVTTPITGEARLFDPRSGAVLSVPLENTLSRDNFDPDASPQITDNTLQLHTAEEYIEIEWA